MGAYFLVCLVAACPPAAELVRLVEIDRVDSTASRPITRVQPAGPIARAVARDAGQLPMLLGAAGRRRTSPKDRRSPADWSRVTHLRSGTEVQLTTVQHPERTRLFVRADATHLTVLDLSDPL